MNKNLWILCIAASTCLMRVAAAGPIALPSTGQNVIGGLDQNYQITEDLTGLYTGTIPGDAVVVTSQPSAWSTLPGTQWIGPAADENFSGYSAGGSTTYQTTFSVANPSTASLAFRLLVDNNVTIYLNGIQEYQDSTSVVFNGFTTPASVSINSNFVSGVNNLDFVVGNGYGPTGIDIKSVPELSSSAPEALALLGFGLACFGVTRRRVSA